MLAKLTVKNQLTLPKSVTQSLGPVQYFEVQEKAGQIILTPVRIQRGDALRAKLAELEIGAKTIESALSWAGKKTAVKKMPPKTRETPALVNTRAKNSLKKPLSEAPQVRAQKTLKKAASVVIPVASPARPTVQAKAGKKSSKA